MKKRLLSLALCLSMLLPMLVLFTSCGGESEKEFGSIPPATIVIALMTDEKTNEAGIEAAEKALNKISEANLNTHIELKLYTPDEYYTELVKALETRYNENIADPKADKQAHNSVGKVEDVVFDEEKNRDVTKYPKPYDNQIDIFLVDSKEMLVSLRYRLGEGVTQEQFEEDPSMVDTYSLLSVLDVSSLGDYAPLLSKYLSTGLMEAGKVYLQGTGELCAIPSPSIYDDAEYMLIDKKFFDASVYNIDEVTDLASLENYLVDFVEANPTVAPLYNVGNMGFVSLTGKNSIIAQYVPAGAKPDTVGLEPKSMLDAGIFKSTLSSMQKYLSVSTTGAPKVGNTIAAADLNASKFAVGFIKADPVEAAALEENYYVIESNKAVINEAQACSNMFAVSATTSDVERCLEVLNLMQTNKAFHNALTYGEENVTYTINQSNGLVNRIQSGDEVYLMDYRKTGNLYLTLPNSEMSDEELQYSENDWALAKAASRHAFFSPYIGFNLKLFEGEKDTSVTNPLNMPTQAEVDFLETLYNEMWEAIFDYEAATEYATYVAYLDAIKNGLKALSLGQSWINKADTPAVVDEAEGSDTEPEVTPPAETEKDMSTSKVVETQLVVTAGSKNLYRQFLDWRKLHYILPV